MDNYNIVSDDTDRVIGVGSSGSSHTNAVVGRRLDQNAGLTLLFFRNSSALSAPESSGSHGAALPSSSNQPDRDTAENQRILIDKLKYRPPRPVIRTIPAPKPAVVSKPVLPSKYPNYLTPKEQLVPDDSTVGDSSKGSLLKKHQIVRTKKASEWLSKEKEEVRLVALGISSS